jgi:cytochrome P450
MKPVLGEGLLTSEGDRWRKQRRAIQPAFRHSELVPLVDTITRETEEVLDSWIAIARTGRAFDVAREMARLTLIVVGKAVLGVDLSDGASALGPAVVLLNRHMAEDAIGLFELPHWVPTPRNRAFHAAQRVVECEVMEPARHGARLSKGLGLIELMERSRDPETGEAMDEAQLRDEIVTMMAAGHETTANALAWTFYCLSQHPEIADAVGAELDAVLGGRAPSFDDLQALKLTKRVLQESMRLHPPAWGMTRRAERDDVVAGYVIRRGATVAVNLYLLHRHPGFWQNPERFDPERFLPEPSASRHRFAYLPFAAGPRACIGRDFAMMEAQLILAMVCQRYRLMLAPGHPVEPEPIITLRPRHGVWMRLDDRSA